MEVHLCRPWGFAGAFKYPPGILAKSLSIMQGAGRRVRGAGQGLRSNTTEQKRRNESHIKAFWFISAAASWRGHRLSWAGLSEDWHTATYRDPDWVCPQQTITCLPWHSFSIKESPLASSVSLQFNYSFSDRPQFLFLPFSWGSPEKNSHNETLNPSSSMDPFLPKVARDSVSLPPWPLTSDPRPTELVFRLLCKTIGMKYRKSTRCTIGKF